VPMMHTALDRRRFRRRVASAVVGLGLLGGLIAAAVAWELGKFG